jgi:DNA polymerase-3 subunit epsilon
MNQNSTNKFLFIDVETNGLPLNYNKHYTDINNWPRIVQIAWIICDDKKEVITERCFIIKPIDFDIPDNVVKVHGISKQIALAKGLPIAFVLNLLEEESKDCTHFVAHNIAFDAPIIKAEFLRANVEFSLNDKIEICTMQSSIEYCGFTNNKYPKLEELYFKLFNKKPENLHDALQDIRYTKDCFFMLLQKGIIELGIDNKFYDPYSLHLEIPKIIPYRKGDRFGYCNQEGIITIDCIYDNVTWFVNDIAFVRKDLVPGVKDKNSLYTIIDKFGGLLKTPLNMSGPHGWYIPNISSITISGEIRYYDEINKKLTNYLKIKYCFENRIFARLENKSVWLNKYLHESICIYDDVMDVDFNKYAIVKLANKLGVIDENQNEIVPCYYDSISVWGEFIHVEKSNMYGIINKNGLQILPCIYEEVYNIHNTYEYGFIAVIKNKKYGFLDVNGNILTDFRYDDIFQNSSGFTIVSLKNKYGVIYKGKEIAKCSYDYCVYNENIAGVELNKKWAIFNNTGEQMSDFIYDTVWHWRQLDPDGPHIDSHGFYVMIDEKYGYVSNKGQLVLPVIYDDIYEIVIEDKILVYVKLNDKWGIYNDCGKVLFDCELDVTFKWGTGRKTVLIYKNRKYGILDKYGNVSLYFMYDGIDGFYDNIAYVKLNNKYGIINKNNILEVDFIYDDISNLNHLIKVKINNKWGCLNKKYENIIDFLWDDITIFKDVLMVENNNKFGLIDTLGNSITDVKYEKIEKIYVKGNNMRLYVEDHKINDTLFKVKLDNKYGIMDFKGNKIISCKYDSIEYSIDSGILYPNIDISNFDFSRQAVIIEGLIYVKLNSKYGYVNIMNGIEYFED